MNQETREYSVNLSEEDLSRHREKLKIATGEQLHDPKKSGLMIFQFPGIYMEGCHRVFTRHSQCLHKG